MITVYGRPDSSAVARVMWTIGELGLEYERVDWGGAFGGNDEAEYRAICPSGKIPAVRLGNGESLWESNAIIRYLCVKDQTHRFLAQAPLARAKTEAWMDWSGAFQTAVSNIRKVYKPADATQASGLPPEKWSVI
ncbi:glutathione S-transferase N-terminal domain-containing protein [Hyphomonas atlantica corrig.]|uniref:glutathione S-transferase N-terminal domain-containing protein n=1 Tax=Hyphomonas atlantica TaxID=1280948 RepID=UPI002357BCE6|nr:glutathione S-transferase N-terminal domain-containing protein [Hyphomonas atlantica]